MKTIEEYYRLARDQAGTMFGSSGGYANSDVVNIAMQLIALDAVEELTNAYPLQFDAYGHLLVRTDHE